MLAALGVRSTRQNHLTRRRHRTIRWFGAGDERRRCGDLRLDLDRSMILTPMAFVAALPRETWDFQVWHRDMGASPTSNYTKARRVILQ